MQNHLGLPLIIYLICLTAPAAGQGSKDPFVGTFSGSGLTLTLTSQNGQYAGSGGSGYTSETTIELCSQGFFRYGLNDETVWNAGTGTVTGGYTMNYGKGSGTWRVISQNSEAVLQLNYYDGKVASYQLSSDEKGRTYLDGDRYLRTCDPNDQVVEARPNCW